MSEIDANVLALIRCPVTQTPVRIGSDALMSGINEAIGSNALTNRIGQTITDPIDGVLVNESGDVALAIRSGIIQLIADEAIAIPDGLTEIAKQTE